ncbi:molybdopterin-dependent oxidoreductase [Methylobacterium nodulans]|uniref:Oxidoreductase molybdopterin binding n=1 Tax=Methylobacterium nodulans (strain LMG 21967 / CNCM I-2342 / ORS 2060) TaxID=460265 RepID=B8IFC7_METNO|nr:molybdopterin-dependent oxidoreductase [Methylobacterium nodulans]ACL57662.1 oxidoreductase molybdopterin binding [Methylobacterium nodulans ORS 2060]
MIQRREILRFAGLGALAVGGASLKPVRAFADELARLPFGNGERPLVAYPGKRPLLEMTSRPPQLETPFGIFDEGVITPNDAFFVRYHLADLPTAIDPDSFRLEVTGHVETPLSLSLAELRALPGSEVVAVNQCSGNSRGFVAPRVAGGQLANGAMGNARWAGVPLRSVLDKAGLRRGAVQVAFEGLDGPVLPATPDYAKALDLDHARDGEVLLAYAMNGAELPWLNGYPLRLVVPGYYGTYWVKHLNRITVLDQPFESFWMKSAYRIPANACACTEPGQAPTATVPIGRYNVRSFVTNLADGARVPAGETLLRGIAFDGGSGVTEVAVSTDDGRTWRRAALGEDLGRYSFRPWSLRVDLAPGAHAIRVRATNRIGQTQPLDPLWNPAGYMRNVVETTRVQAA